MGKASHRRGKKKGGYESDVALGCVTGEFKAVVDLVGKNCLGNQIGHRYVVPKRREGSRRLLWWSKAARLQSAFASVVCAVPCVHLLVSLYGVYRTLVGTVAVFGVYRTPLGRGVRRIPYTHPHPRSLHDNFPKSYDHPHSGMFPSDGDGLNRIPTMASAVPAICL